MKRFLAFVVMLFLLAGSASGEEGYTWADLEADVQTIVKGNLGYSDSVWLQLGNMGVQNLSCMVGVAGDTVTIIIAADTPEYDLPADFSMLWATSKKATGTVWERFDLGSRGQSGTGLEEGVQHAYTYSNVKKKVIGWYPTPTGADTALIYYFRIPVVMDTSTDTIDVLECFHSSLVTSVLIQVYERSKQTGEANRMWALLPTQINWAKAYLYSKPPDIIISPRMIGRDH